MLRTASLIAAFNETYEKYYPGAGCTSLSDALNADGAKLVTGMEMPTFGWNNLDLECPGPSFLNLNSTCPSEKRRLGRCSPVTVPTGNGNL